VPVEVDQLAHVDDSKPLVISWRAAGAPSDGGDDGVPGVVRLLVALGAAAAVGAVGSLAWGTRRTLAIGPWRPDDIAQVTATIALFSFALAGVVALMLATPRV
jgi:hypothetical protein